MHKKIDYLPLPYRLPHRCGLTLEKTSEEGRRGAGEGFRI